VQTAEQTNQPSVDPARTLGFSEHQLLLHASMCHAAAVRVLVLELILLLSVGRSVS
jgi:hypothetical protein